MATASPPRPEPSADSAVAFGLGALAALLGAVSLVGWWLGAPALSSFLPGAVTMKANTALGMAALGIGLMLGARARARDGVSRLPIRLCVVGVAGLAGATLLQDLSGISLGLDEWVASARSTPTGVSFPGRMSPSTATCFLVGAGGLWAVIGATSSRRRAAASAALGLSIATIAALTLAGHGSAALVGAELWSPAGMSVPTALGFLCCGGGMLTLVGAARRPRALDAVTLAGFALGVLMLLAARQGAVAATARMLDQTASVVQVAERSAALDGAAAAAAIEVLAERARLATSEAKTTLLLLPAGAIASLSLLLVGLFLFDGSAADREEALAAQRSTDARTSSLVRAAMDAIISIDVRHRIILFNPAAEAMFGRRAEEMLGQPLDLLIPERFRGRHGTDIERFGATGVTSRAMGALGMVSGLRADGGEFPAEASISQVATDGTTTYSVVLRDVTERERAADALRERERQLHRFIEESPAALAMFDRDMRYVVASRRWHDDLGISGGSLVGRHHYEVFPDIPERWKEIHRRCLAGAAESADEDVFEREDGSALWLRWKVQPWHELDGSVGGLIIFMEDLSKIKERDAALASSETRFHELAHSIDEVFWSYDPAARRVLYVSPAFEDIWGLSIASLRSNPGLWLSTVHPDDRERVTESMRRMTREPFEEQYRILRPDGAERWVRARAFPVRGDEEPVLRVVGVAEDITQRRLLEAQFQQAQKMEAMGRLAGGVAHDFNNLLTVITGYGSMLLDEIDARDPRQESVREMLHAADRASMLTGQLLAFGRQQVLEPKVLDLNAVVADSERMLRRLIGEDVSLTTSLSPTLGRVRVDVGQITQVLLNLAVNARDAMPDGGHLTIETRNVELDAGYVAGHAEAREGEHVLLAVADGGTGMSEAVREHALDPFFTTKGPGRGTGLGLSVVHGIVRQSGGHIGIYSEVGVGTTIKVYLPIVDAEAEREVVPRTAAAQGDETVLLVEDDESVRRISVLALEQHGYSVLEAADATAALAIAAGTGPRIDLLLTDVVMPAMNGRELAARVRQLSPTSRVLFVSGYTDHAIVRHGVLEEGAAFLQKPFTPHALATKVREVLDAAVSLDIEPA